LTESPFIVFALPRSRTAWLAQYLAYDGRIVGHDIAPKSDSIEGFFSAFDNGMSGTVETGAMMGWRLFRERFPEAAIAVIRRPVQDVKRSLGQFGIFPREGDLEAKDAILDEIAREAGVLSVSFFGLYNEIIRRSLFEHCLPCWWDQQWDKKLAALNIQIDVMDAMKKVAANQDAIIAMKKEIEARANA
jgi:hypothetical protein